MFSFPRFNKVSSIKRERESYRFQAPYCYVLSAHSLTLVRSRARVFVYSCMRFFKREKKATAFRLHSCYSFVSSFQQSIVNQRERESYRFKYSFCTNSPRARSHERTSVSECASMRFFQMERESYRFKYSVSSIVNQKKKATAFNCFVKVSSIVYQRGKESYRFQLSRLCPSCCFNQREKKATALSIPLLRAVAHSPTLVRSCMRVCVSFKGEKKATALSLPSLPILLFRLSSIKRRKLPL